MQRTSFQVVTRSDVSTQTAKQITVPEDRHSFEIFLSREVDFGGRVLRTGFMGS